ncbi:thiamine pyridinylase [Heyndrickxia coagulans]|uniref:thiamine pyridinylase n=1 Tax=Heyndrickxia coagulans TaxID=1398 RepID=UPI000D735AE5|nr:thiamine pyridinylase [Heyndrickxia coagulans]AWP36989.1 thiamine pyridinylase [Heyndrickxia coagulans]QDI62488.1 thiamine pyridinylase [Heyndrickxia coagulans]
MKRKGNYFRILSFFIVVILAFNLLGVSSHASIRPKKTTLNVALYGYVPDIQRFEKAVLEKWSQSHPNVQLNFVNWDSYDSDPPKNLDVFVFDAIYMSYFIQQNYLLSIPSSQIRNKRDILKFALDGTTYHNKIYAIPQILCTNLLYTRKSDKSLKNVKNIPQLYNIIGQRQTADIIPPYKEGLLIDMSGGTTKACMYLEALIDLNHKYTDYDVLPDLNKINSNAVTSLKMLQAMAGNEQANFWPDNDDAYIRAKWFENGNGRAFIGYSEAMSAMPNYVNQINFKPVSLSSSRDIPLFYGDVVGVNSHLKNNAKKKKLALDLANIIASSDTMILASKPSDKSQSPQYLLPARYSVYQSLGAEYPVYQKLLKIASNPHNRLFKTGPDVREWLDSAKQVIPKYLEQ